MYLVINMFVTQSSSLTIFTALTGSSMVGDISDVNLFAVFFITVPTSRKHK